VKAVRTRPNNLPVPLDARPDLWDCVMIVYAAFKEARHAVTHRRAQVTRGGDLEVYDDAANRIDTVTSAEIAHFTAAVHALAEAVINGRNDRRQVKIVAHHLNALGTRHRMTVLPAIDPEGGRRQLRAELIELADGRLRFDVARARAAVEGQVAGAVWDLELYAGERIFVGQWEDVPDRDAESVNFHPASTPAWLSEELPSGG
jgi:hypothetical protein